MPKIRFYKAGKWLDNPRKPNFDVEADQEMDVSPQLAEFATRNGAAEYVVDMREPEPEPEPEAEPEDPKEKPRRGRKPGPSKNKDDAGATEKAEGKPED